MLEENPISTYSRQVASAEDLDSSLAIFHRERIFDVNGFSYRNSVELDPKEWFDQLPDFVTRMNEKIEEKNKFINNVFLEGSSSSYENYLLQLKKIGQAQAIIEPFDFDSIQPSALTIGEIFKEAGNNERKIHIPGNLTSEQKIQFLSHIASLELSGDTRLGYDSVFPVIESHGNRARK